MEYCRHHHLVLWAHFWCLCRFAAAHEGLTYRFASHAHLRLFEASPERYLPEYGAFCSWGMSTEFAPDWRWARDNLGPRLARQHLEEGE